MEQAEKQAAESNLAKQNKGGRFKVAKSEVHPSKYGTRVDPPLPMEKMKRVAKVEHILHLECLFYFNVQI